MASAGRCRSACAGIPSTMAASGIAATASRRPAMRKASWRGSAARGSTRPSGAGDTTGRDGKDDARARLRRRAALRRRRLRAMDARFRFHATMTRGVVAMSEDLEREILARLRQTAEECKRGAVTPDELRRRLFAEVARIEQRQWQLVEILHAWRARPRARPCANWRWP